MASRKKKRTRPGKARKRTERKATPTPSRQKRVNAPKPVSLSQRMAASFGERVVRVKALETLKRETTKRRSRAAKKGAATRRAKHAAAIELGKMLAYAAEGGASVKRWKGLREKWHASKWDLFDAVDQDRERYLDILDDIADEADTDWQIAYGPEPS